MRFQDLERHEQDKNRYSRLKAFQGTITDKDANESRECQQQFQNCRAKPVPSWLHPEFQGEGQQKNTWHPAHERTEHGRHREEQGGCKPKQWSPRNTPIPLALHGRSEEHTSELQSRGHLVCRLLLEKKRNAATMHRNSEIARYPGPG